MKNLILISIAAFSFCFCSDKATEIAKIRRNPHQYTANNCVSVCGTVTFTSYFENNNFIILKDHTDQVKVFSKNHYNLHESVCIHGHAKPLLGMAFLPSMMDNNWLIFVDDN